MRLGDQVTRQRAALTSDGYGNQRPNWSAVTTATYPADVQPLTTDEDVVDQDRRTTRWRIFLAPGTDLLATDRILWDGDVYEVDGDVQRWKRRGVLHHLEAVLIKVTQGVG